MRGREVLTPAEYGRQGGLSKTTVIKWCELGILPAIRVGSRWYLKRSELVRSGWLEGNKDGAAGTAPSRDD